MHAPQLLRTAFAAAALVAAMTAPAHAQIVAYTGPAIPITQSIDGLYLNVVTGASASLGAVPGWDLNIYDNGARISLFAQGAGQPTHGYVGAGDTVDALTFGSVIGPATSFTGANVAGGFNNPVFETTGTHLIGFRFINEPTGTTHFGWARFSTGADAGFPAAVLSYAFESTPNLAIQAGVVPEPGTYALMLAGLAGVAGFAARRRKAN